MKIVNKKEFLTLPENTVYSNFSPGDSITGLFVKGQSLKNDWFYEDIIDFNNYETSNERYAKIEEMQKNVEHEQDYGCQQRDGMYEDEQYFLVYTGKDVEQLINKLKDVYYG